MRPTDTVTSFRAAGGVRPLERDLDSGNCGSSGLVMLISPFLWGTVYLCRG